MSTVFVIVGGLVFALMGGIHMLLSGLDTLRPKRFTPVDDAVRLAMSSTGVGFSGGRATMWAAWLGFNLSHGLGRFMYGAAVAWLGLHGEATRSALFLAAGIGFIYVFLALRFWFYAPALRAAFATACLLAALML